MVIFRDYQEKCIETIHKHFQHKPKQLIQLPTGSGKTYIFLEYLRRYSKSSLIIVPTIELLEQVKESSENFFHRSEVYAKTGGRYKSAKHIIVTAASLNHASTRSWLKNFEFDTIIIDEAHRAHSKTYIDFIEFYTHKCPLFNLLGFTATPERLDGKLLLDIFHTLSFDMSVVDLIKKGHLCDIEATRYETGEYLSSQTSKGDFRAIELRNLDNENRNKIIYNLINEHCKEKQTIIFCLNILHSESLAKNLRSFGFNCEAIHGKLTNHERRRRIQMYRDGRLQIVTNCQLLTEGFDAPCTKAIVIARPTRSKSLYCQMIGRGLRNFHGKECCYLYELTDNNHKICTFNVLPGAEPENMRSYSPGTRLSEFVKNFDFVDISDLESIISKSTKFDLFDSKSEFIESLNALDYQLDKLKKLKIKYYEPVSFEEANFLLWKHKKMRHYGIN